MLCAGPPTEVTGRLAARDGFGSPLLATRHVTSGGRRFIPRRKGLTAAQTRNAAATMHRAAAPSRDLKNPRDECPVFPHRSRWFLTQAVVGEVLRRYEPRAPGRSCGGMAGAPGGTQCRSRISALLQPFPPPARRDAGGPGVAGMMQGGLTAAHRGCLRVGVCDDRPWPCEGSGAVAGRVARRYGEVWCPSGAVRAARGFGAGDGGLGAPGSGKTVLLRSWIGERVWGHARVGAGGAGERDRSSSGCRCSARCAGLPRGRGWCGR